MPVHTKRCWQVSDVDDEGDLVDKLTRHSWTLCTGFRHRGYLFLCDDFTESSAGEWAVVKEETLLQVETITFGWMTKDPVRALSYVRDAVTGRYDQPVWPYGSIHRRQIHTTGEHGTCPLCA